MTRNVRLVFGIAGVLALALAFVFGPLFAGYAFAGAALAFIAVVMGMRAAKAVGDWRLEHPRTFGRTRATTGAREEERPAA